MCYGGGRTAGADAQETDAIGQLSREYFAQLTGGDRDFLQVSQQEIYELYSAYHRANRMVEEMTARRIWKSAMPRRK